jgi:hypothetical protein
VSKHWQSGDKCLAAIHLTQIGLADIDEDADASLWRVQFQVYGARTWDPIGSLVVEN